MSTEKHCDNCKRVIDGEVKTKLVAGTDSGELRIVLKEADWCQSCANKAMSVLCKDAWDSVKRKRKVKPVLKVAA